MLSTLLSALGSKVVIGVAAGTLAAGSVAAATVGVPAVIGGNLIDNDTEIEDEDTDGLEAQFEIFEEVIDTPPVDDDDDGDHGNDDKPHPDNFGATVSEDARDGGVDGQEISDAAHARNEERRAARDEAREQHGRGAPHGDDDANDDDDDDADDLGGVLDDDDADDDDDDADDDDAGGPPEDRNGEDQGRGHGRGGDGEGDDD